MQFEYAPMAIKQMARIPADRRQEIKAKVERLAESWPEYRLANLDVIKLTNRPGYRMRVGRYRVLFDIIIEFNAAGDLLTVSEVVPRSDRTYS